MIKIIDNLVKKQKFLKTLEVRGNMDTGEYALATKQIVEDVRINGDTALFKYTAMWDCETIINNT